MNKHFIAGTLAAACMLSGATAFAQVSADTSVDASVDASVQLGMPRQERERTMQLRTDAMEKRQAERDAMMEKRQDAMEKRQDKMDDRMEKRQEMMQKFDEKTIELRAKFQEQFAKRSIRAVAQVKNIIGRFTTLLEKMKAGGKDTAAAEAQLTVASNAFVTAQAKLDALKALYPTDGSEMTDEQKSAVMTAKTEAETAVKAVHEELHKLLNLVKGMSTTVHAETSTSASAQ